MESDLSIRVRGAAVWLLMIAVLVITALAVATRTTPTGSPWSLVPVVGLAAFPLAGVAFLVAPWPLRLLSALKTSGHAMLLSAGMVWISPESIGSAVFPVVLLSMALTFAMWRANKAERAAEAEART
ncbi:hypothetical protein ACFZCY_34870 [Streptomyces sp. NPDC007983]|uniref:hypothetical protein n=1 Tax=Streptomyces sp. NPDC007983 TaxID=3364800 RepID=UPI0036E5414D